MILGWFFGYFFDETLEIPLKKCVFDNLFEKTTILAPSKLERIQRCSVSFSREKLQCSTFKIVYSN